MVQREKSIDFSLTKIEVQQVLNFSGGLSMSNGFAECHFAGFDPNFIIFSS